MNTAFAVILFINVTILVTVNVGALYIVYVYGLNYFLLFTPRKQEEGKTTAIFEPYLEKSTNVKIALPIISWLSILCIKKDCAFQYQVAAN